MTGDTSSSSPVESAVCHMNNREFNADETYCSSTCKSTECQGANGPFITGESAGNHKVIGSLLLGKCAAEK